jgi:type III pantothenate kinase
MTALHSAELLLDLGNSRIKWAWSGPAGLVGLSVAANDDTGVARLLAAVQTQPTTQAWLASVVNDRARLISERLGELGLRVQRAQSLAALGGLRNGYDDPTQLGVDRFLALLGGCLLWPGQACLVVDAGTALTIDHLDANGHHLGGCILPGLSLMRRALAAGTDRLGAALEEHASHRADAPPSTAPAHNTRAAIEAGILSAATGAIETQRGHPGPDPGLPLLLCGGDAALLAGCLRPPCRLLPELVLLGLAEYAGLNTHVSA